MSGESDRDTPEWEGGRLRDVRKEKGMTQDYLAARMKVTASLLSKWERGAEIPNEHRMQQLAKLLDCSKEDFFSDGTETRFIPIRSFKLYEPRSQFEGVVDTCLAGTKKFVHYALLCETVHREYNPEYKHLPHELQNPSFIQKIRDGELIYDRVEVFFSEPRFVQALRSAKDFLDTGYRTKFFRQPPKSVPTISYRSYDDETFIIGGFHFERNTPRDEQALLITGRNPMKDFFVEYWRVLWGAATDLWDAQLTNASLVAKDLDLRNWEKTKDTLLAPKPSRDVTRHR